MNGFAELREEAAPAEIVRLYADLRVVSGVPNVNLIWRHLATMPGMLAWAWQVVRPQVAGGMAGSAAGRLRERFRPRVDSRLLAPAPAEARRLVAVYNLGNSLNLVVLTCLRLALEARLREGRPAPLATETRRETLPAMPRRDALEAGLLQRVDALAARHAAAQRAGVTPSLYLHLAHWPALLPAVEAIVGPLLDGGDHLRLAAEARQAAEQEARDLLPGLRDPGGGPSPAERAQLASVLDLFTGAVIPEMIPVGLVLEAHLSGD